MFKMLQLRLLDLVTPGVMMLLMMLQMLLLVRLLVLLYSIGRKASRA